MRIILPKELREELLISLECVDFLTNLRLPIDQNEICRESFFISGSRIDSVRFQFFGGLYDHFHLEFELRAGDLQNFDSNFN